MLELADVHAVYGRSHVLHGVSLRVGEGEVVSLLGRNGAGRTTTMRAIMGLTGKRTGSIRIRGTEAINLPPHKIARATAPLGVFQKTFEHKSLFERGVLVQRHDGARRHFEQDGGASLVVGIENLHLDAFELRRLPGHA